jgi:3-deoxy-manno-octulosonate cytidylyltransferase (CMP-KDO synthetase)
LAIVAIIPARFASTRLPGKPLSDIHGKPMIQHVYERVSKARGVDRTLVATDDERIASAVRAFGGEAVMTSTAHASGTDRLAEAARSIDADVLVNAQGDEPMLDPAAIDSAVAALRDDPTVPLATVSTSFRDEDEVLASTAVKVVVDGRGDALYFSRSVIPHVRGARDARDGARQAMARGLTARHVGLYVYRREALLQLASLPPTAIELAEGLEQLRALHAGMRIRVVHLPALFTGVAVDTPEDLERVRGLMSGLAPQTPTKGKDWRPSTSS